MRQPEDKMTIRLPDGLRDRINAAARANKRSANAELVFHLEQIFAVPAGGGAQSS